MASEPDEFEIQLVKNCPSDASYYYLLRFDERGEAIRFPLERALRIRGPFEHPIDCKPGFWLAIYTSDHLGHHKIQHIGGRPHVEVRLNLPASVCAAPSGGDGGKTTQQIVEMLASSTEEEDDADGSLKATRIEAKKREIALELTAKEQKLMLRAAKNKEIAEGFLLNRHHRLENREQSEAMFKLQNQTVLMMERNFVLMEKMQEVFGRFAEIEKAAAQKMASPPPPVDYTPVLSSVVGAIRDIGVSALQRDDKKKLKPDEESPVKAALTDKAGTTGAGSGSVEAGAANPTPARSAGNGSPALPAPEKAGVPELLAIVERMQAERERLQSELAAERNRQRVLEEISAEKSSPRATPARANQPARSSPSAQSSSPARNLPSTRSSPSAQSSSPARNSPSTRSSPSPRPTQPVRAAESSGEPRSSRSAGLASTAMPSQRTQAIERAAESAPSFRRNQPRPHAEPRRLGSPGSLFPRPASRNAPCACGSGRKFKHCCMHKHRLPLLPETLSRPAQVEPPAVPKSAGQGPIGKVPPNGPSSSAPQSAPGITTTPGPKAQSEPPERVRPASKTAPSPPSLPAPANRTAPPPESSPPASHTASLPPSPEPRPDVARVSQITAAAGTPQTASVPPGQGTGASAAPAASPTSGKPAPTPAAPSPESPLPPIELPPGVVREEVQELLVNMLAGKLLTDPEAPVARPQVPEVKEVDAVLVAPPKMDRETAEKLLRDGSTLEAFGAFLFFNPALRAALLSRRGK